MNNGKNLNLFIWQFHLIHIEMNSNAKLNQKEIVILNKCLHKWMCITEWRSHWIKWNGNFWQIRLKTAFRWKNATCVCTSSILSQSQPIHPIQSNLFFGFGWLFYGPYWITISIQVLSSKLAIGVACTQCIYRKCV